MSAAQLRQLGLPVALQAAAGDFSVIDSERGLAALGDQEGVLRATLFWRQPPREAGEATSAWLQQRLAWHEGRDSYWSRPRVEPVGAPIRNRFGWMYARTRLLAPLGWEAGGASDPGARIGALQASWGWEVTGAGDLLTLVKLDHETNGAAPALVASG